MNATRRGRWMWTLAGVALLAGAVGGWWWRPTTLLRHIRLQASSRGSFFSCGRYSIMDAEFAAMPPAARPWFSRYNTLDDADIPAFRQEAAAAPERPELVWRWWWRALRSRSVPLWLLDDPAPNITPEEVVDRVRRYREAEAEYREDWRALAAWDPDNGWTAMQRALLLACTGTASLTRPTTETTNPPDETPVWDIGYAVIDPAATGAAERVLREALARPYLRCRIDEYQRARLAALGRPRDWDECHLLSRHFANGDWDGDLVRLNYFIRQMLAEAQRRAPPREPPELFGTATAAVRARFAKFIPWSTWTEDAVAPSDAPERPAPALLRDLQTLGARLLRDNDQFDAQSWGRSVIYRSTNEGARLLRAAGLEDEAETLLARGRRLLEPELLTAWRGRLEGKPTRDPEPVMDDPALAERARAMLAAGEPPEQRWRRWWREKRFGFFWWGHDDYRGSFDLPIDAAALEPSRRMDEAALQRTLGWISLISLITLMIGVMIWYFLCRNSWRVAMDGLGDLPPDRAEASRRVDGAVSWPSVGTLAGAAVDMLVWGVLLSELWLAGFRTLTGWAGVAMPPTLLTIWLQFVWLAWVMSATAGKRQDRWLLRAYADLSDHARPSEETVRQVAEETEPVLGYLRWSLKNRRAMTIVIALILGVAAPLAAVKWTDGGRDVVTWVMAGTLLAWLLVVAVSLIRSLYRSNRTDFDDPAWKMRRARLVVPVAAVILLTWLAACGYWYGKERAWVAGDSALIPRPTDPAPTFPALGAHDGPRWRAHVASVLAAETSEAVETAASEGEYRP